MLSVSDYLIHFRKYLGTDFFFTERYWRPVEHRHSLDLRNTELVHLALERPSRPVDPGGGQTHAAFTVHLLWPSIVQESIQVSHLV